MNRTSLISFLVASLLFVMVGASRAAVDVHINIHPPVFTFPEPPELVVIPNTYIYFAPAADLDIVFYHGYWYRHHNHHWYRGAGYNGPWHHFDRQRVPRVIIDLPPNYRRTYHTHPRIPYHHVHNNWNQWERERYWHRRHWNHRQDEWKRDRREQRQDVRERQRDRRDDVRESRQERRNDRHERNRDGRQHHREGRHDHRDSRREHRQEAEREQR